MERSARNLSEECKADKIKLTNSINSEDRAIKKGFQVVGEKTKGSWGFVRIGSFVHRCSGKLFRYQSEFNQGTKLTKPPKLSLSRFEFSVLPVPW